MTMRPVRTLFGSALLTHKLGSQIAIARIRGAVQKEINRILADPQGTQAKPLHLKHGILTIECAHPAAAQELKMNERQLLDSARGASSESSCKGIRYIC